MDCAFLTYQSKDDAFAGTALLEVAGHGEDGVATALLGHAARAASYRSCSSLRWLGMP